MSATSQSSQRACPKCQRPLPANAPQGICPFCLFERMLTPSPDAPDEVSGFEPVESRMTGTRVFGEYELLDEVARGGMGVVYRARHRRLNRVVALKMVLAAHLTGEMSARRFRMEAEAAASLDHPNIVPIYEVGETDGRLFYTMKFAEGGPLPRSIEELQLRASHAGNGHAAAPLGQKRARIIELLIKVAGAVHHAHQRGLLHRDIKPSNILLDATGEPAVADFGLARWIEDDNELTASGAVVGSPSYMSPEQAAGRAQELTTAADVYGLGAVLFYLLTGRAPFAEETAVATMRAVIEREAPRPSSLNPAVDRDLDTICRKCLEKDPGRRYQSARALAEDLERLQRGEPILARPAGAWEQTAKWARRNPARALVTALLILAPAVVITLLATGNARVQQAQVFTRLNLYAADMQVAQTALEDANLPLARQILENYRPRPGEPDLRGFEWRYLWQRARSGQLRVLRQHAQPVNGLQFSPDGHWLASCELGRTAWFWSTTTWKPERVIDWSGESQLPFRGISYSRDGALIVVTMDGYYCPIFDAQTWQSEYCIFSRELTGAYLPRLEWSPVSDKLAFLSVSSQGQRVCGVLDWAAFKRNPGRAETNFLAGFVADTAQVSKPHSYPDAPIRWLPGVEKLFGFTRNGDVLASQGGRLMSFAVERDAPPYDFRSSHAFDYCELAANGQFIAGFNALPKDRHSVLMDEFTPGYTNCWEMIGHEGDIRALAISPDSRQLVSGSADHTARVWDAVTRKTVATLRGHADEVTAVAWSPDGSLIATGSKDKTVMLWSGTGTQRHGLEEPLTGMFAPWVVAVDGSALAGFAEAAGSSARRLTVVSLTGGGKTELPVEEGVLPVGLSAGAEELLCVHRRADGELELRRWDLSAKTNSLLRPLLLPGAKTAHLLSPLWAISADHRWLARSGELGSVDLWSLAEPQTPGRVIPGMDPSLTHLVFAPDGNTLAVSHASPGKFGLASVWRLDQPMASPLVIELGGALNSLVWSPDATRLVAATDDRAIRVYDAANGRVLQTLAGHKRLLTAVAYAPDGQTLASTDGRTIKLWHAATGREMLTIYRDPKIGEAVQWLEFTRDGLRLLAGDASGRVQIFLAAPANAL